MRLQAYRMLQSICSSVKTLVACHRHAGQRHAGTDLSLFVRALGSKTHHIPWVLFATDVLYISRQSLWS
jgi:hypothetical protein